MNQFYTRFEKFRIFIGQSFGDDIDQTLQPRGQPSLKDKTKDSHELRGRERQRERRKRMQTISGWD
jgi:hypothetical protein